MGTSTKTFDLLRVEPKFADRLEAMVDGRNLPYTLPQPVAIPVRNRDGYWFLYEVRQASSYRSPRSLVIEGAGTYELGGPISPATVYFDLTTLQRNSTITHTS